MNYFNKSYVCIIKMMDMRLFNKIKRGNKVKYKNEKCGNTIKFHIEKCGNVLK